MAPTYAVPGLFLFSTDLPKGFSASFFTSSFLPDLLKPYITVFRNIRLKLSENLRFIPSGLVVRFSQGKLIIISLKLFLVENTIRF